MLSVEYEKPRSSGPCPCCGRNTTTLTRFISTNGEPWAVWHACFTEGHPDRFVLATVSLGDWDENATVDQRVAFAFQIRPVATQYDITIIDSEESPWRNSEVLGRTLDRSDALGHPLIDEVFHIVDHMVSDDVDLRKYLDKGGVH